MKHAIAILAAIVFLMECAANSNPVAQSSPESESLPLLTNLELVVSIDFDSKQVVGTATLTLKNTSTTPLTRIPLILNRLMHINAVRSNDGTPMIYHQEIKSFEDYGIFQINATEVDLLEQLLPEASIQIAVDYQGYLVGYTEVGMRYVRDQVDRSFTILREDALAFPVVGVPSFSVNRTAPRNPFDFEVSITVPEDLVVATGGEQVGRMTHDGLITWRYRSRQPAPYLIVAIAPYRVVEADGLRVFHFPEDSAGAQGMLQASLRAVEWLQELFGPLEGSLALNVMEIPNGWGSQASLAGGIIQEADALRDRNQIRKFYHELSHLWNARDLDTPSPRWNEGLAMFLQDRMAIELDGWDGEIAALEQTKTRLLDKCGGNQRCSDVPLRNYGTEAMTDLSYSVGRMMFATLYNVLGEETFDRALYGHYQAHKQSGTNTDDMVRAFVDVGGPVARRIFDDWLESTAWVNRLNDASSLQAMFDDYRN